MSWRDGSAGDVRGVGEEGFIVDIPSALLREAGRDGEQVLSDIHQRRQIVRDLLIALFYLEP